jgi:CRP/FNR family cyclic AMP-dependent transcriptional regulator
MATKSRPSFDPKSFLAVVGEGRGIGEYRKDQIVFSQGDPADAVFYQVLMIITGRPSLWSRWT